MKGVNFVRELVPPYPPRTNARAGRALRQLSLVGTDAEPTQPTQPTQAGDVMANLNAGAFEAPEGSAEEKRGNGPHFSTVFRLYGPHHQKAQSLAGSRVSTGRTGSYPQPEGEAS